MIIWTIIKILIFAIGVINIAGFILSGFERSTIKNLLVGIISIVVGIALWGVQV